MAEQNIVIVCGGRNYNDRATVYKVLDQLQPDWVVIGACGVDADTLDWKRIRGADRLAYDWVHQPNRSARWLIMRPAAWKRLGKKAGPIRNRQMANEFPTATVVAFPGGKGTANMVSIACELGMTVRHVTVEGALI